jgi:hypothetical protein
VRVVREFGAQEVFHSSCDSRRLVPTRSTALSIRHPRTATAAKEAARLNSEQADGHGTPAVFAHVLSDFCLVRDAILATASPALHHSAFGPFVGCAPVVVKAAHVLVNASGLVSFSPKFDPSCPAKDLLPLRFCFDLASLQSLRSTPPPPSPIPSQTTPHKPPT